MRTLLLSDLHSNLEATEAVLAAADRLGPDRVVILGDLAGYGASPEEVIRRVRELRPAAVIRGNHDRVVAGIDEGEDFNFVALQAALQNRRVLSPESREYLAALPAGPREIGPATAIAHGSPLDEDEYLVGGVAAGAVFRETRFDCCFVGHTHIPCLFESTAGRIRGRIPVAGGVRVILEPGSRYIVNPGSVGQPRDEDPRAAFALFDEPRREITFHRVEYPIRAAQDRIREAGLPPVLAERLALGI